MELVVQLLVMQMGEEGRKGKTEICRSEKINPGSTVGHPFANF
ncbi:hypothetical protein [Neomoorella thermoacetica]|nr:hypothetical protein [Moorella thermoacetica]